MLRKLGRDVTIGLSLAGLGLDTLLVRLLHIVSNLLQLGTVNTGAETTALGSTPRDTKGQSD